jgi:hypothetical protein
VKVVDLVAYRVSVVKDLVVGFRRGYLFGRGFRGGLQPTAPARPTSLEEYFDAHLTGPGLWKWRHYFPIYERHFAKFRGREVHIVEIGIFSGGSLDMWKSYFGEGAHVYGVDLESACLVYEGQNTRVFIGDQSDPDFWRRFLREVPEVDIVIDDGGHEAFQQIPTLEALLGHIRPGGVYLCEDLHGRFHGFLDYLDGLSRSLHAMRAMVDLDGDEGFRPTDFQRSVDSVHLYPFVAVIEKRAERLDRLVSPKHGTEWQPFLPGVTLPPPPDPSPLVGE